MTKQLTGLKSAKNCSLYVLGRQRAGRTRDVVTLPLGESRLPARAESSLKKALSRLANLTHDLLAELPKRALECRDSRLMVEIQHAADLVFLDAELMSERDVI